jgi:DNA-binding transcriptional regulator YhcF (GntR family)
VSKSDPTDLYEQVAAEIARAIADREAKPGERLLPPRISPPP